VAGIESLVVGDKIHVVQDGVAYGWFRITRIEPGKVSLEFIKPPKSHKGLTRGGPSN
jgi:hypothetical protein